MCYHGHLVCVLCRPVPSLLPSNFYEITFCITCIDHFAENNTSEDDTFQDLMEDIDTVDDTEATSQPDVTNVVMSTEKQVKVVLESTDTYITHTNTDTVLS